MAEAIKDLETTIDGDLIVTDDGDLKITSASQSLVQDVIYRVRTNFGDYASAPSMGANLIEHVGSPNSARTLNLIREQIAEALFLNRRFLGHAMDIRAFAANRETVGIVIGITPHFDTEQADILQIAFKMNLLDGTVDPITI